MHPILFELGPITLYSYGLFVALGLILGMKIAQTLAAKAAAQISNWPEKISQLALYVVVGGLIGGRLFYVALYPESFRESFWQIFKVWQGGLVSFGGLLGAGIGLWLWQRRRPEIPTLLLLDALAPALAFGHAVGRVGCLMAGCCYGRATTLPWGVVFDDPRCLAPLGEALHPTQIYESLFLLILGAALVFFWRRQKQFSGKVFGIYLLLYGTGRFAIEFFRQDPLQYLHFSSGQWMSLAAALAAVFFLRKK